MSPLDDLRPVEPSRELDERVRRAARAELRVAMGPQWRVIATRAWSNVALPAAIGITVVGYLHWAFVTASALYQ
jgi:hypothetical protein